MGIKMFFSMFHGYLSGRCVETRFLSGWGVETRFLSGWGVRIREASSLSVTCTIVTATGNCWV